MTAAAETVSIRQAGPGALSRAWAFVRHHVLTVYAAILLSHALINHFAFA